MWMNMGVCHETERQSIIHIVTLHFQVTILNYDLVSRSSLMITNMGCAIGITCDIIIL